MLEKILNLCGIWRFRPDLPGEGEALGYAGPAHDDVLWRQVALPADVATCHPQLRGYRGPVWFRRTVVVPEAWRGGRVVLRGVGINGYARLWVNGREVGECREALTPFVFEVQGALIFGDANVWALRVDTGDSDGRALDGMVHEMALAASGPVFIAQTCVTAEPDGAGGHLTLRMKVQTLHGAPAMVTARARVLDGDCPLAELTAGDQEVSGDGAEITLAGRVPGAQPWSPSAPALYALEIVLISDGRGMDTLALRTGFRKITAGDRGLRLNGEPIFLTGFTYDTDAPDWMRSDLEMMKTSGANFVRLCAPYHPRALDLCDELGLLALVEMPPGEGAHTLQALLTRDGHHPSVIFWAAGDVATRPALRAWLQMAKRLDPTRLAIHVEAVDSAAPDFDGDDVICVRGYPSVDRLRADPAYDLARSTAFWRESLAVLHARYPGKPLLVAEFGAPSLHGVRGGLYGEDTQATILRREFAGMDAAYVCGATIYRWRDPSRAMPDDPCGIPQPYGVWSAARKPRTFFWLIRDAFREKQGVLPSSVAPSQSAAGYSVHMVRTTLTDIPPIPFPAGFHIRTMRPDEGGLWRDIWRDAETYFPIGETLFENQFGYDPQAIRWRCYLVVDERDIAVGTISAWYNQDFRDGVWGQIHWVALRPAHWGKGLAKPMLSHALTQMAQWHGRAFLGTQTKRLRAIKLYLNFGFVPDLEEPGAVEAWREVASRLAHPALEEFV
ncbi:MAG: GNAT family N-acetyltransferase [Anaerolineae bacterium]|nr:GNAT family N-acetyltransferase [Anaerolineae bacterium]